MAKRCNVDKCKTRPEYQFLAVTGDIADRIVTADGTRLRACRRHLLVAVDQITAAFQLLPDGGPARIRAVQIPR